MCRPNFCVIIFQQRFDWPIVNSLPLSTHILFDLFLDSFRIFWKPLVIAITFLSFKGITHTYLLKISITHNKNAGNNLQPVIKYIETTTFLAKFFSFPLINVYGSEYYKTLQQFSSPLRSLTTCSQSNSFDFFSHKNFFRPILNLFVLRFLHGHQL